MFATTYPSAASAVAQVFMWLKFLLPTMNAPP